MRKLEKGSTLIEVEIEVEYINAELKKGRAMSDIEKESYEVSKRTIDKRLKRRGYTKIDNQYILADVKTSSEPKNKPKETNKKEVQKVIEHKEPKADLLPTDINITVLGELVQMVEPLKELLHEYHRSKNIIEVPSKDIKIRVVEEVKARQFKIDKTVSDSFDKFCKEHKEYSVQDLINTALIEFIEKHS